MPIPPTFFAIATLTRLYLGVFEFPDTRTLPRAASFPHLRELGLCCVGILRREDMDFVLTRSPVLEILCIQVNMLVKHLLLLSRSLRCVQIIESIDLSITVKDAPHLERLVIWAASVRDDLPRKVKIGHAPALSLLGYLDPERHSLEIGNTVIKVGAIECVQSHMKLMVFYGFRGERGELSFLKFVLESARALTKLVIVFTKGSFTSMAEASSKGTRSRAPLLFVAATFKEKPGVC
ncbi:uncharacterized protein LOC123448026 isoform X2 [Hordeum vulgare subsp. vulgare]|uniref:uncharacterized protein LOC123448026 isoform X2 n=1 Tax=Hordeum vulgare subsp. vulgare TaxID=112509 RepID=UPI001D1A55FF|nr:uncharacterized protein LOC123448026 isoform X2 [Hordeum vulgare subsp. vulgare]